MHKRKADWKSRAIRYKKPRVTRQPYVAVRSGFGGPSLRGIIGAPNGLYNQRFGQRQERKFFDVMSPANLSSSGLTNNPQAVVPVGAASTTPILLNGIAEGTDYYNRVGRDVTMKSLYFQGEFAINPSVAATTSGLASLVLDNATTTAPSPYDTSFDYVRILIVYDLQTNGSFPPLSDVIYTNYISGGVVAAGVPDTLSFMNLNYRDRFKIVMDKRFPLTGNMNNGAVYIKKFKKLSTGVTYTSTSTGESGSTIGSIATGALLMYVFSQYGISSGLVRTRVRFTDA